MPRPNAVQLEVLRVLRPDGPLVVSFSNRCFWTKAVAIWRALDDDGHIALVERYLRTSGFARIETHRLAEWVEDVSDPLFAVIGHAPPMNGDDDRRADRQRVAERLAEFRQRTAGRGSPSAIQLLHKARVERIKTLAGPDESV